MATRRVSLEVIELPAPCPADWDGMAGDDRARFCGHCSRHVYDLSALTRAAAEQLLADHGEHPPCVRLYRRRDGTVVTADCQPLWRRAARPATAASAWVARAVAAAFGLSVAGGCAMTGAVVYTNGDCPADAAPADPGRPTMGKVLPPGGIVPAVPATRP